MLALHRTLSFRYIRQRWSRAALVVASIALGVATLVATRALNQCMTRAARGAVTPLAGAADLFVSHSDHGVRLELAGELRRAEIPGVAEVQPLILARVSLPDLENRSAMLVGIDLAPERVADNPWGIEAKITNPLAMLTGRRPVMVGTELAAALQGDAVRVRGGGQVSSLAVLGTVDAKGSAASLGGNVLVMRLADAAQVLGKPDLVTRIDIVLAPGADREKVRSLVAKVVGDEETVRTPESNNDSIHDVMAGLELGFMLGGVGALVVGLFLVYNALSVTVAERRHDIGILRSLGATRGQVAGLFALEAVVLGIAGAALGVPLGIGIAHLTTGSMQTVLSDIFLPMDAGEIPVTTEILVTAILAGVVTALLAAIVPAIRASSQEPADAVRRVPLLSSWRYRALQIILCSLLFGGGVGLIFLRQWLPLRMGSYGGIVLVLLGILMATPLLAEGAARLVGPFARQFLSIEARLAADNLARSSGRTGLVIAALAAGVALMVQTAGLTLSSEEAILTWIDQAIAADLFVTCNSPVAASGNSQPMEERLGREIAALPEVAAALPVRFQHVDFRTKMVFLIVLDADALYETTHTRPAGVDPELYRRLTEPGTCLISENFALLHHVRVGDRIALPAPGGPVEYRVVGTVLDYTWNRGAVFVNRTEYRKQFRDTLVDSFDIYLRPGAEPSAVADKIRRNWGADHSLWVSNRTELRETIRGMIGRLYGLAYAQQLVIGLVAGLGVVMALLISVLQRRRELGLLRAIGASRRQVLLTVLAEAILMGGIGAGIGLLVGIPLEWYAVRVILLEETGFSFVVRIPWVAASVVAGLALGVATLAGLGPAVHAMRQHIAEAIAYE
ncbi:MAG: FtsX-like permease family protein [Gemmataceae bacterium]|nr:FtsX-like permease family protein [Gemmataceae bacterium]